jgi:phosphotriesterase-related protein
MSIMAVTGKINTNDLGMTAPHEHIFIDMEVFFSPPDEISAKNIAYEPVTIEKLGVLKRNPFAVLDNVKMTDEETQLSELNFFKAAGGSSIVDATSIGLGRDPELLAIVSVKSGLNIIAGSGFYVDGAQTEETRALTIEDMENQIVQDIESGIGHTRIRAGIIGEIGISHIMYPFEKKSLIAACRAQIRTGAPLMIHINPWSTMGLDVMKIVDEYGVPHEKLVICHSDVENREDYIFELLDMGVYVEFDNFGKEMFTDIWNIKPGSGRFVTDWERVLLIKKIVDRGYAKQFLLSTDICLKSLLHAYGGWGYDHILTHIVPMMDEVGVSSANIDQILIKNPICWLDCDAR